jgi:hypothetical protein
MDHYVATSEFVVYVRGGYRYRFTTLVISRELSPQRLGYDPLQPRYRMAK